MKTIINIKIRICPDKLLSPNAPSFAYSIKPQ